MTKNPTYRDVCGGDTNHNEVVRVVFDPKVLSYAELLRTFWSSHNPTTLNKQGNDRGTQYRSSIFYYSDAQKAAAEASKLAYGAALTKAGRAKSPISTEILPVHKYWIAEVAHKQYDAKPGSRDYCGLSPLGVTCPPAAEWMPQPPAEAPAAAAPDTVAAAAAPPAASA